MDNYFCDMRSYLEMYEDETNRQQPKLELEPLLDKKQQYIDENNLKMSEVIEEGAPTIHDHLQQKLFSNEKEILCSLEQHPNVLGLIGLVPNLDLIVLEFPDTEDLGRHLRNYRPDFLDQIVYSENKMKTDEYRKLDSVEDALLYTVDLVSFAYQIANGMSHLASLSCVHRDLALHNIYVTKNKTIRIGGFGLARIIDKNGYHRIASQEAPLHLLWMAPETFRNNTTDEKSDVWSFGVCLYELFTLGKTPNLDVRIEDVEMFLKSGGRLPEPTFCTPNVYNFMKWCWNFEPKERPCFSRCVEFFSAELGDRLVKKVHEKLDEEFSSQQKLNNWARGKL
ncbi:hypothetical protein GCK72_020714 [Caenorhabditis remanei]|uniref:receptor protein-tyrosine kinase n=1 Tax=Caenorhabditis remanei TaxID=31234 RepID=A0A6A5GHB2_CAERE|nr:hypothetical protein GCK72_020714 [Caenorhabditis remanei]KAF1754154.1 hypothetical protein GCK72_020714 [Caenorhabditis remanei]